MLVSERQQEILGFITAFVAENGYPPTHEEIRTGLDLSTKSLVSHHLEALQAAGHLSRVPNTPRGLRLRPKEQADTLKAPLFDHVPGSALRDPGGLGIDEVVELTRCLIPDHDADRVYALRVRGQALIDALVNDGDIVVVRLLRESTAADGELVAARLRPGNTLLLRRIYRRADPPGVRFEAANPAFKPIEADPATVEILGKVAAIIRQVD